jgi:hypothetical protein
VFVPGKPFQPCLMFVGKVMSLPKSGVPERCFTQVGSALPANIRLVLKGLLGTNTKLLRKSVNYSRKKFKGLTHGDLSSLKNLDLYSQHFIFVVTYEWTQ